MVQEDVGSRSIGRNRQERGRRGRRLIGPQMLQIILVIALFAPVMGFHFLSLGFVLSDKELSFSSRESLQFPGKMGNSLDEHGFDL